MKSAALTEAKQNVEKQVSELAQKKQAKEENRITFFKPKTENRELPNAGASESHTMPLGVLSILGGILLLVRNKMKKVL
ncbi:LPXTG cell wall anchor domain-containing protein [Bacillus cytotoxicus]